jgi:hypothetical protein
MEQVDPTEVHAVVGTMLGFLAEATATRPEVQAAALRATANLLDETMNANSAVSSREAMRDFWRRRMK